MNTNDHLHTQSWSPKRTGAATIEILTAGVLFGTVMTFLVPFVGRVSIVNEEIADRELALREVQNATVQIQLGAMDVQPSEAANARLQDPQLIINRASVLDDGLVPVVVSMSWKNRYGERTVPISLTCWIPVEVQE